MLSVYQIYDKLIPFGPDTDSSQFWKTTPPQDTLVLFPNQNNLIRIKSDNCCSLDSFSILHMAQINVDLSFSISYISRKIDISLSYLI